MSLCLHVLCRPRREGGTDARSREPELLTSEPALYTRRHALPVQRNQFAFTAAVCAIIRRLQRAGRGLVVLCTVNELKYGPCECMGDVSRDTTVTTTTGRGQREKQKAHSEIRETSTDETEWRAAD